MHILGVTGIIFPGEATFTYVEQARGNPKNPRVYMLKFPGSGEKLFFWMQVRRRLSAIDEKYIFHSVPVVFQP
jgi:hypothetical protein